jgi:hypothetical protein
MNPAPVYCIVLLPSVTYCIVVLLLQYNITAEQRMFVYNARLRRPFSRLDRRRPWSIVATRTLAPVPIFAQRPPVAAYKLLEKQGKW